MSETGDAIAVKSAHRSYAVEFVEDARSLVGERLDRARTFVVCDEKVHKLWHDYVAPLVESSPHVLLEASEAVKTIDGARSLLETMVDAGIRRDHTVLAIGGGVIQDVAAFAASILYRGLPWVFVPTTLLAQADSCIGSKTSINLGHKKNLLGTFWPPEFAAVDLRFLETLSEDDIRSGIGEMLHFYIFADSPQMRPMVAEHASLLRERARLRPYIRESLLIKKSVVERDEFDRGERHKFNYGHTFGHALESLSDFSIPHGEAVTVGMDIANFVSMRLGLLPPALFQSLHDLLVVNFPRRAIGDLDLDRYCAYLARDKKNTGRTVGCILVERPGSLVARQLPLDADLRRVLLEYFDGPWWTT